MTEQTQLIEILNNMNVHPIVEEKVTDEIKEGKITNVEKMNKRVKFYQNKLWAISIYSFSDNIVFVVR